ncbi:HPr kinase/phosphorylase [Pararhizobium sp. IMCC21322]|uniref:HPr kinase/phosphorylase n=1 Tax=Pararhizobium sp. IMCC21322 TaxID=3067903 RepID=UPI002741CF55|nr:serine kinase [Pararhizobium sp. IMCC21322]
MSIDRHLSHATATQDHAAGTARFYTAYGLVFASALVLPELIEVEPCAADVWINIGNPEEQEAPGGDTTWYRFEEDSAVLHWDAVGTFKVRYGNEIVVEQAENVADDLVAFPLLGPVLAVLLHQRGLLILHASSISIKGRGLCLLGDKGAGKSTTAASLVAAGHMLLTDDIVAIECDADGDFYVLAGFPQIKLAADAGARIGLADARILAQAHPSIDKNRHRLMSGFSDHRVKLEKLFILVRGNEIGVTSLSDKQSLDALIRYSYMSRFGTSAMAGASVAVHLMQCAKIAGALKVNVLTVPDNLGRLGELVDVLERQAA